MVRKFGAGTIEADTISNIRPGQFGRGVSRGQIQEVVASQQKQKQLENERREAEQFQQRVTYDNYESEYARLSPGAKEMVKSPEEIKSSGEYKQYVSSKRQQAIEDRARDFLKRKIEKGSVPFGAASSDPEAFALYQRLLEEPDIKRQVEKSGTMKILKTLPGDYQFTEKQKLKLSPMGIRFKQGVSSDVSRQQKEMYMREGYTEQEATMLAIKGEQEGVSYSGMEAENIIQQETKRNLLEEMKAFQSLSTTSSGRDNNLMYYDESGKPIGIVTKAPTLKEIFKQEVSNAGYIKGTLGFAGGILEELQIKYAEKTGDYYQQEAMRNFAKVVPYSIYSTPLGPYLLATGGIEDIGTKSGRERLSNRGEMISDKSILGKQGGLITSYALSLGEIGLGYVGIKNDYMQIKTQRMTSLLKEAPTVSKTIRIETEGGGIDIIKANKITNPRWYDRYLLNINKQGIKTEIIQPFIKTKNVYTLEGGKGTSYLFGDKGKVYSQMFTTGGKGFISEGIPSYTTLKDGLKLTTPLKDFQGSYGKVFTQATSEGSFEVSRGFDPLRGGLRVDIAGKISPSTSRETLKFVGAGIEKDGAIKIFGGDASKLRYNLLDNKFTIKSGGINFFGNIKRLSNSMEKGYTSFSSGGLLKKTFGSGTAVYQQQLTSLAFKQGMQPIQRTLDITKSVNKGILKIGGTYKVLSSVESSNLKSVQSPVIKTKEIVSNKIIQNDRQNFSLATRQYQYYTLDTKQQPRLISMQLNRQLNLQLPRQSDRVIQVPMSRTAQKTVQNQRLTSRSIIFSNPSPIPKTTPGTPKRLPFLPLWTKGNRIRSPTFGVQIKRFGKFTTIGKGLSLQKAMEIGRTKTSRTLAATFRVLPEQKGTRVRGIIAPLGFRTPRGKKRKETPLTFIELPKYRLSRPREVSEIQSRRINSQLNLRLPRL